MFTKLLFNKNVYLLTVYILVICQPSLAVLNCDDLLKKDPEITSNESLWMLLDSEKYNGAEIIDYLSRDAQIKELFEASAGVWEEYSIREHTLMVFSVFAEQFSVYQAYFRFRVSPDVRLFQTLKFSIALHDIGKPYAIRAGNKNRQHEFTIQILEKALSRFGFSTNEMKMVKALVGNDIIGDLVKGVIDPRTAKLKLEKVTEVTGIPLADYIPLQFLFYTIDAASYPTLRQRIFITTEDGCMVPNRSQFQQLWDALSAP
jgi:hypothetical protein